jgi:hypothetical protein
MECASRGCTLKILVILVAVELQIRALGLSVSRQPATCKHITDVGSHGGIAEFSMFTASCRMSLSTGGQADS